MTTEHTFAALACGVFGDFTKGVPRSFIFLVLCGVTGAFPKGAMKEDDGAKNEGAGTKGDVAGAGTTSDRAVSADGKRESKGDESAVLRGVF